MSWKPASLKQKARVHHVPRTTHTTVQRQTKPLEKEHLEHVHQHLLERQTTALDAENPVDLLRLTRDRSLLLLGFWRAFKSDELTRMRIEDVD